MNDDEVAYAIATSYASEFKSRDLQGHRIMQRVDVHINDIYNTFKAYQDVYSHVSLILSFNYDKLTLQKACVNLVIKYDSGTIDIPFAYESTLSAAEIDVFKIIIEIPHLRKLCLHL